MYGIETSYCNAMIEALLQANWALMEQTVEEATDASYVPHKGDTLGIDQIPENTIASVLTEFDPYAVLITEERGEHANPLAKQTALSIRGPRTFFVCDPCDRSSQFCAFLKQQGESGQRVIDVLKKKTIVKLWEDAFSKPAPVSGANAAITCVRRGIPIGTAMLNYMTQELIVACSAGIFCVDLGRLGNRSSIRLEDVDKTQTLMFPNVSIEWQKRFVTFMGKPERGYPQNFAMTRLAHENQFQSRLHYDEPGGPTRILYLSEKNSSKNKVGFVVANGEKIGEWVHWIPFVLFAHRADDRGARALQIYEIIQDESALRDQYLMCPPPPYSIFKDVDEDRVVINVDRLSDFDNPSKYRATLLVAPATNDWAIGKAQQYGYRPLVFYGN